MIGVCTESSAQLPIELIESLGVEVVPVTVTVDGVDFLEGVNLDCEQFYRQLASAAADLATSQPSPGQFAAAYEALMARGCTSIVSIHAAESVSGSIGAARVAKRSVPIPVKLIDSGTTSFGIGYCVMAAADAIHQRASIEQVVDEVNAVVKRLGTMFVVSDSSYLRATGRLDGLAMTPGSIPVLSFSDGRFDLLDEADTMDGAIAALAERAAMFAPQVRVAVGSTCDSSDELCSSIADAVSNSSSVVDVIHHRVTPSVGIHTGPGTAGVVLYPVD